MSSESNNYDGDGDGDLRGLVGLQNLGNTCYINSALQALSNCQQLTQFVLGCPNHLKEKGIFRSYSELIDEIWNQSSRSSSPYTIPSNFIRNIRCIYPAFRGCTQQDTQEFLRCLLEQLHDELKQQQLQEEPIDRDEIANESSERTRDCGDANDDDQDDDREKLGDCDSSINNSTNVNRVVKNGGRTICSDNNNEASKSIISDTFDFKISSSVVCSSCNNISTRKETFKDLSIPIPSKDHPYYTAADDQDPYSDADSNSNSTTEDKSGKFSGENANSRGANSRSNNDRGFFGWFYSYLDSWFWGPQVTLQDCLAIFFGKDPLEGDNEYSCEVCTKKNRGIKYLKILELPEVLCIHFKRYESIGSAKITTHVSFPLTGLDLAPFMSENSKPQCTTYNLIACICHHGTALLTGHYTTYALNCYDDQWYEFDDQYVSSVQDYQVENSEAYILFYQKSTLDDKTERQRVKASKLLQKSLLHAKTKKYFISKQWVNKFNTFVEPGPIRNMDFLCPHLKVSKSKQPIVRELVHEVSEVVWKYLVKLHGGGPECGELIDCDICE